MKHLTKIKERKWIHIFFILLFFISTSSSAFDTQTIIDSTHTSAREDAMTILMEIDSLLPSAYWPNIKPALFLQNLKNNIREPLGIYEGSYINFCGYAAISYLPLHYDPVRYVKFLLELYATGKAQYGSISFSPAQAVKNAAGTIQFKGILDINHADQMWFLSLSDHFKGYLNFLKKRYSPGDEKKIWAAVNFSKFNRMISTLFNYKVESTGRDIKRLKKNDIYSYLKEKLKSGITFLYVDNYTLTVKKHHFLRPPFPTHFLVLLDISNVDGLINLAYWDYGFRTYMPVTPGFLNKILFGVTQCTIKSIDDR